jgi:hypothetical protein
MYLRKGKETIEDTDSVHEKVRNILSDHIGYVLVTCRPAEELSDKLELEFSFDGDPDLAEIMLDGAQAYFEEQQVAEQA